MLTVVQDKDLWAGYGPRNIEAQVNTNLFTGTRVVRVLEQLSKYAYTERILTQYGSYGVHGTAFLRKLLHSLLKQYVAVRDGGCSRGTR
jgi:hypothetical protein